MILRAVHILCFAQAIVLLVLLLLIAIYGKVTFQEQQALILGLEAGLIIGIGVLALYAIGKDIGGNR